jgi:8-oxo-dGTP diphosphatase
MPRRRFRNPLLTVDALWIAGGRVLLVRRGREPFKGRWALPGGFVEVGESVEEAVLRELSEETGLAPREYRLQGVYSRPGRDPRRPTVSVVFRVRGKPSFPTGGSDAREARWLPLAEARGLAFDHDEIVRDRRKTPGFVRVKRRS